MIFLQKELISKLIVFSIGGFDEGMMGSIKGNEIMQHAKGNLNPSSISTLTSVNAYTPTFVLKDTPLYLGIELSPFT
jgi:hypothetical protein